MTALALTLALSAAPQVASATPDPTQALLCGLRLGRGEPGIVGRRAVHDKLHLILVVYSPVRFAARFILTKNFIRRIESRHAKYVERYIVELVYGDQKFMMTSPINNHHLQLRTSVPLWCI